MSGILMRRSPLAPDRTGEDEHLRMDSCIGPCSLLLFFFFLLWVSAAHGADILRQGVPLEEGDTLISRGEVFELGFFTPPGANPSRRYVGIWYYNLPARTVVWVANRNDPLTGPPGGSLSVADDGNVVILDGGGKQRWATTNLSAPTPAGAGSVLQLMDNGNLFLNTSDGRTVRWQSFEHPTDTFLPGMRITVDFSTRDGRLLRSWRSAADPSEGEYALGLDPAGTGQVFTWRGSAPHWRSGQLIGGTFSGVRVRPLGFYGWQIEPEGPGRMALTFSPFNASLFRFVLHWDGRVNALILADGTRDWSTAVAEPSDECDRYNSCGNNSRCGYSDAGAVECECLNGFRPRSEAAWRSGNWSGGCVRRTLLRCETNTTQASNMEDDGFWVLRGVKLPDLSSLRMADEGDCRRNCLGNCSCTAYAYGRDIGGCLTWSTTLVDVQQFPSGGNDLYIKLAGSELAHGQRKTWIAGLVIALFFVIIVLLSFCLWWRYRAKIKDWWKKRGRREETLLQMTSGRQVRTDFTSSAEFLDQTKDGEDSENPCSLVCFERILAATGNFSETNKLGEGGFGVVYKGVLPEGKEVAVKRLSQTSGQGLEEFKNEVMLIAKLQHRNLVRLMGYCIQEDEKILIYEYLPNKSLDAFIFNPSLRPLLDWRKRINIIEGIARGLLYLHRDSRLRIIHRDLKASNVLLDEEMNPKISDFGMARIFGGNQNQANTTRVVGTFGYLSPEYAMEGLFSIKSDVYSFGVLTLEIITGQRNGNFRRTENSPNLVGYAWKLWNEDRSLELVDPLIRSSISTREVMRCIQVGLLCVQDRANERPTMSAVVFMLGNEAMAHPVPKQPTFTLEGSPTETESLHLGCESFSNRDVTVTVVTGR